MRVCVHVVVQMTGCGCVWGAHSLAVLQEVPCVLHGTQGPSSHCPTAHGKGRVTARNTTVPGCQPHDRAGGGQGEGQGEGEVMMWGGREGKGRGRER